MRRALLWGACSSLLLVVGFALYLLLVYALKRPADPEAANELRQALEIYGRLVSVRGLLPQLWIALLLSALLERAFPSQTRSRVGLAVAVAVAAGLAGLLVASTLLPMEVRGTARVVYTGTWNFVATWLELSAGVTAAALLPRWLGPSPRSLAERPPERAVG
jgi:hypothetical protein